MDDATSAVPDAAEAGAATIWCSWASTWLTSAAVFGDRGRAGDRRVRADQPVLPTK